MRLLRRIAARQARMLGPDPYEPPHNPYDYDPHLGGGYPGHRAPPPDLTDLAQMLGLDPRDGDTEVTHQTLNHPWGKVVQLHGDGRSITLVQTEAYPRPFPWAIQARFSTDGKNYTPTVPAAWGGDVIFKFTKSFDVKTGPAIETFDLVAGEPLPICALIARKLTVQVKIVGESVLDLWVAFVVCPTQQIDCAESSGVTPGAASESVITRIAPTITSGGVQLLAANPLRKGFVIQNHANSDLYVALGPSVTPPGGSQPAWSFILPGLPAGGDDLGVTNMAGDGWVGPIFGVWLDVDAGLPDGYAMATEMV